jgi:hypothetical protein
VPEAEPHDGKLMPEIVWSQGLVVKTSELANLRKALCRPAFDRRLSRELRIFGPWKRGVALTGVSTKGRLGCGVNWDETVFAEFCLANKENPIGQINVGAIKPHFARSQPRARQQTDQRRHRPAPERDPWRNAAACGDEQSQLSFAEDPRPWNCP